MGLFHCDSAAQAIRNTDEVAYEAAPTKKGPERHAPQAFTTTHRHNSLRMHPGIFEDIDRRLQSLAAHSELDEVSAGSE